ncbi:hypothetical protein ASD11_16445 [Aeromicrobium sp. Root495]|uniref:SAF domain-containing protein n=1 Tax=Aeromicrobium sp. Root495 TaxID=1736550 RepID=UPI0006F82F6F|nr:SAF domain-containing protein [Aeromicrobium sp. Root495]KQY56059.1 hypothetical protein ASD11_16445 [Aeromicrobium sp. Root495]
MARSVTPQGGRQATVSRLPSTRESRPALLALAVVLILGGALASAYLAIQSGNRASFVQVKQEIAQGARITPDDLTTVSLPEDFQGGVASSQTDKVVGQSATTRILPGTVLTPDMTSEKSGVAVNQTQLTIPVASSPFVRDLQPGAQMALAVGGSDGASRSVFAELVAVGEAEDSGIGGGGNDIPLVVSIDLSCLTSVAKGVEDNAVTPALLGSDEAASVQKTCGA